MLHSKPFRETGAIFWKDFWKTKPENPIWKILGIPCDNEHEQESGQIVVDKSRPDTWKALNLALYMQVHKDLYFKLLFGDKDTFKYAWRALNVPYHMVTPFLGIAGTGTTRICGHTVFLFNQMVQFSPLKVPENYEYHLPRWNAEILFMHMNFLKYLGPQKVNTVI